MFNMHMSDCCYSSAGVGGGVDEQPVDLPEVSIGAAGDADSEEGDSSTPSLGDRDGTE